VNLAALAMLFLAFRQPAGPGALVAGYAMCILFWIVSITPQGIGIVEGVTALVLASLGVPAEKAAVIALAFRGLTFWLPFGIGFFQLRRVKSFGVIRQTRAEAWGMRAIAILAGLAGLAQAYTTGLSAFLGQLYRLAAASIDKIQTTGRLTVAVAGFTLLILAGLFWRRE
jgi:hypothetical protein